MKINSIEEYKEAIKRLRDLYRPKQVDATIYRSDGTIEWQQLGVECPESWSDQEVAIVAHKYFYGQLGTPQRESSVYAMIERVCNTIALWAGFWIRGGEEHWHEIKASDPLLSKYGDVIKPVFSNAAHNLNIHLRPPHSRMSPEEVYFSYEFWLNFRYELEELMLSRKACFNSPVWFNLGTKGPQSEGQQASACFINRVEDSMITPQGTGILDMVPREGKIFKWGSGSGCEISRMRSSREGISGGGKASGGVSFARTWSKNAGQVKSGGRTRRAAIMRTCAVDYGDIVEFVKVKAHEEKKAKVLAAAGFGRGIDSESYATVDFQNENLSVRLSDAFMQACESDGNWDLVSRTMIGAPTGAKVVKNHFGQDGYVIETIRARDLMQQIAQAAWECGDPGVQFHDTINRWHTCIEDDKIWSTNPCSEYLFLDNTSCNLASLNLMAFLDRDATDKTGIQPVFRVADFQQAIRIMIEAMDVLVSNAEYPTPLIGDQTNLYRTLGLGYANLGALLMACGLPYASEMGRNVAAVITSLLCSTAYRASALLADRVGPFARYKQCEIGVRSVLSLHQRAHKALAHNLTTAKGLTKVPAWVAQAEAAGAKMWEYVQGCEVRNAQVVVIAPTGTIAFMMGCETTGIEPYLAPVQYKKLAGGGQLKLVCTGYRMGLETIGLSEADIKKVLSAIEAGELIEDSTLLSNEQKAIFDTSFEGIRTAGGALHGTRGSRFISWQDHVAMLAAVQPFVSGSISKTINMPSSASVGDVKDAYMIAWRLGLKCLAIYRDGSKDFQPVSTTSGEGTKTGEQAKVGDRTPARRKLPRRRRAQVIQWRVGDIEGYMTPGYYEDGSVGECFVNAHEMGSAVAGWVNAFSIMLSLGLQYGIPLKDLVRKFMNYNCEPAGFTDDPEIRSVRSIQAYVVRRLGMDSLSDKDKVELNLVPSQKLQEAIAAGHVTKMEPTAGGRTGAICGQCGGFNVYRTGAGICYQCRDCGWSDGGCGG